MATPFEPGFVFPPPLNPDNPGRGHLIMGLTWTFTIIAIFAVALRIYLRKTVNKISGIEDWLMVLAAILQIVFQACVSTSYHYGLGKHDTDLYQPDEFVNTLKWTWISSVPGVLVATTARISIAILLIRIFGVHKWFRWFLIIFTTLQTVAGLLVIPVTWAQTTPASGLWEVYNPNVKRWNPDIAKDVDIITQSLWTCADFTYVFIPVIIIWNLNMALRQRIGLMLLMSASLFTMAMSILKVLVIQKPPRATSEVQYIASLGVLWTGMEQSFVIIMGCVPTLRSISKLEIPGISAIGSSLSSLVKRNKSKQSSMETDENMRPSAKTYLDLEMNTNGLGNLGHDRDERSFVATSTFVPESDKASQKGLVTGNDQVRRTDRVTVSFDTRKQTSVQTVEDV